jgi:cytochrome c oxidase assembly protein subunit 15
VRRFLSTQATTTVSASESTQQQQQHEEQQDSASSDPQDQAVSRWLFGSAALVFGMVVVGGITRLTESGLSITDWKPLVGVRAVVSKASKAWR